MVCGAFSLKYKIYGLWCFLSLKCVNALRTTFNFESHFVLVKQTAICYMQIHWQSSSSDALAYIYS
jgi:hypothetical protein